MIPKPPKFTEIKMAIGYLISLNFSHLKTTPCDVWKRGVCNSYMAFQKLLVVTSRQSLTNLDPIWWWIFRKTVVRNVEPTPTHQPTPTTRQGAGRERPTNGTSTPGAGDVKKFLHVHINTEHMKTCVYKKTTTVTHHLLYIFLGLPVYLTKILQKMYFFIFGVVLGARHKFATTGKLRVGTIVSVKVKVGITIWYPLGASPGFLQIVVFGTGIPVVFFWGSWFLRHAHIDATSACYKND